MINTSNTFTFLEYDKLDSTNEEIKRLYNSNLEKKLIVVTSGQSSGKGRYKRKWISPYKCGLYSSYLIDRSDYPIELLPLSISLACVKSLDEYTFNQTKIKWPNDLILKNKKLGGVLIERYEKSFIVGIGINLFKNKDLPPTAISLEEVNSTLSKSFKQLRNEILHKLTCELEIVLNLLSCKKKKLILQDVVKFLTTPQGSLISFIKEDGIFHGKVVGLSEGGELIVELESDLKSKSKKIIMLRDNEVTLKV